MRIDQFQDPESQDDEVARSDVHRRIEFKINQLQWAPLWSQRAASDAKVVGCYVGRQYADGPVACGQSRQSQSGRKL